jgi:hypothetical protein
MVCPKAGVRILGGKMSVLPKFQPCSERDTGCNESAVINQRFRNLTLAFDYVSPVCVKQTAVEGANRVLYRVTNFSPSFVHSWKQSFHLHNVTAWIGKDVEGKGHGLTRGRQLRLQFTGTNSTRQYFVTADLRATTYTPCSILQNKVVCHQTEILCLRCDLQSAPSNRK